MVLMANPGKHTGAIRSRSWKSALHVVRYVLGQADYGRAGRMPVVSQLGPKGWIRNVVAVGTYSPL
ncbi:hypothetical protein BX600DRAFT_472994 [Xylariales sp. PMI_506]|nr:hypothetical protein BX600DRAFT_472994 [Xylariales sp. PMI_506]